MMIATWRTASDEPHPPCGQQHSESTSPARRPPPVGLYDPAFEHDACGVAFVARLDAVASHETVQRGITALENLEHRGAAGADPKTGDGAGILHAAAGRALPRRRRRRAAAARAVRRRRLLPSARRRRARGRARAAGRATRSRPRASASSAGATSRSTSTPSATPPRAPRRSSGSSSSPPRPSSPATRTPSSASST